MHLAKNFCPAEKLWIFSFENCKDEAVNVCMYIENFCFGPLLIDLLNFVRYIQCIE
jgi:hypothetical protein